MQWQDAFGHLSYLLLAASYMVTDMAWLRALAIAGLLAEGAYFYFASNSPLWVGIGWSLVFIAINVGQLGVLLRERLVVRMTGEERRLHARIFPALGAVEFSRILRVGQWKEFAVGTQLTREGEPVRAIHLVVGGQLRVEVKTTTVARIAAGGIVGEMSFLSGRAASATTVVTEALRAFEIPQQALSRLLEAHPEMRAAVLAGIGSDLLDKIDELRTELAARPETQPLTASAA
jgi:CRP-like cAMP-binding protein